MTALGITAVVDIGEQGSGNFWLPVDFLAIVVVGIIQGHSPANVP